MSSFRSGPRDPRYRQHRRIRGCPALMKPWWDVAGMHERVETTLRAALTRTG
jgi:hypothetical protein